MADDASGFTGSIPDFYDRCLGPVIFAEPARRMARHVGALSPARLLETAAGTGIVTREVLGRLPSIGRYVASDLNGAMLAVAKGKFVEGDPVSFETADATALPFEDGSFDALLCQFGVMFFPDKAKGYSEARRVLAPGGHYLFTVWDSLERNPAAAVLSRVIGEAFPENTPTFFNTPYGHHAVDPIRHGLQDGGFDKITVHVIRTLSPVSDPDAFAEGFVRGTPFSAQIAERGADPAVLQAEIARAFRQELGPETPLQYLLFDAVAA